MASIADSLRAVLLSAQELRAITNWPEPVIEEWLNAFDILVRLAEEADDSVDRIEQNETDIQTNADNFSAHNTSTTQHGVTGNNVGTEDYAQTATGGVVFLADLVNDAVQSTATVTTADAAAAPAAYDQTHIQSIVDLANDTKAQHNQLVTDFNNTVTQLNDIIQQMKDAKQMSLT